MIKIQENKPIHYDIVKDYFADNYNVHKISTPDFRISENEITKCLDNFIEIRPN
jgi:hypothetical protein